jgi:hypothetical protein|tara:strand:- start:1333 stop:1770 length:438 start_codon:yes stop_codon:yes gene_type:complete
MIKSFRGKLTSDSDFNDQQIIRLSTNKGEMGYRIVKFQVMPINESDDVGAVVKIFRYKQDTVDSAIDFSNETMLAAALYRQDSGNQYNFQQHVIFDNVKFNQDIFVTYKDNETSGKTMNYYIELEQVKLDLNEATVATLKDMRGA